MSEDPRVILLIEDEAHTRALLHVTLRQHGFHCIHASTGVGGAAAAIEHDPSLVLLDLGLPDLDGIEVTHRIREESSVPIIVLSAREQESDKIAALDGGANDYMTKPFQAGELMARIRVALRSRSPNLPAPPETGTVMVGELSVDFDARRVAMAGSEVALTPTEYRLLGVLIGARGRVLTHRQILQSVWGSRYATQTNYLRVYMKKLRHKIEPEPARPRYLLNMPGVGYRFLLPE